MPLPLAPLLPVVLRIGVVTGVVTGAGWALARWARTRSFPGRTDQRAEDALDDLGEGLSSHRPADRATDRATDRADGAVSQRNLSARARRVIRFRGQEWEVDAGLIARLRLRRRGQPE